MRDLSRAQQRCLNLPGSRRPRSDDEVQPLTHVILSSPAQAFLREQLYASGAYQGGPLFGTRDRGELRVQYAAPAGYACGDSALRQQPLVLDTRYVLGWSDALAAVSQGELDWVGQWMMYPDRQLAALEHDLAWLRAGLDTALFDEEHVLLVMGWEQGELTTRGYGFDWQTRCPLNYISRLEER